MSSLTKYQFNACDMSDLYDYHLGDLPPSLDSPYNPLRIHPRTPDNPNHRLSQLEYDVWDFYDKAAPVEHRPVLLKQALLASYPRRVIPDGLKPSYDEWQSLTDLHVHLLQSEYDCFSAPKKPLMRSFEDSWTECLGDLSNYRLAIEDEELQVREEWRKLALKFNRQEHHAHIMISAASRGARSDTIPLSSMGYSSGMELYEDFEEPEPSEAGPTLQDVSVREAKGIYVGLQAVEMAYDSSVQKNVTNTSASTIQVDTGPSMSGGPKCRARLRVDTKQVPPEPKVTSTSIPTSSPAQAGPSTISELGLLGLLLASTIIDWVDHAIVEASNGSYQKLGCSFAQPELNIDTTFCQMKKPLLRLGTSCDAAIKEIRSTMVKHGLESGNGCSSSEENGRRSVSLETPLLVSPPEIALMSNLNPQNALSSFLPDPVPCFQMRRRSIWYSLHVIDRHVKPCHLIILCGLLTIGGSVAPGVWRSAYRQDISGGFALAQYILGVGVFIVGSMIVIHSRTCTCWQ